MTHSPDPGKMACRHAPSEPVAALTHVCKHCGAAIEADDCPACRGSGACDSGDRRCLACRGTGIGRWEAVP